MSSSSMAATAPISAYGMAKAMSEQALIYTARRTGIEYGILRIANPVGRWHKSRVQGLIEVAAAKAIAGEPLSVFGDGTHVRDYFDADDLAEANLLTALIAAPLRGIWNIGSGRGVTILGAIALVRARLDRDIRLVFQPARPWDLAYSVLDPRAAQRDLGWVAGTSIEVSVDKVVRHLL